MCSYRTVELWAAITDTLVQDAQQITHHLDYVAIHDFVNLLTAHMRAAVDRCRNKHFHGLVWLAKYRQQNMRRWLHATDLTQ